MVRPGTRFAALVACVSIAALQFVPAFGQGPAAARRAISALGRIRPAGGVVKVAAPPADVIAEVKAKVGDYVKKGDVLAVFESQKVRQQQLAAAQALLDETKAKLATEETYGDAVVADAEAQTLQAVKASEQQIAAEEAKLGVLTTVSDQAKKDLDRLIGAGTAISQYQKDQQALAVKKSAEEFRVQTELVAELKKLHEATLKAADAKLTMAKATRDRAKNAVSLGTLENQVTLAKLQLDLSQVKAPSDGQVLRIGAGPGEALGPGYPLLEMANIGEMEVVAEVYENDVWGVKLGQSASVTSQAFPKTAQGQAIALTGKVVEIGRSIAKNEILSLNPAADADLRVYSVRIKIDDAPLNLKAADVLLPVAGKTPDKVTQSELASRMLNLQVMVEFAK